MHHGAYVHPGHAAKQQELAQAAQCTQAAHQTPVLVDAALEIHSSQERIARCLERLESLNGRLGGPPPPGIEAASHGKTGEPAPSTLDYLLNRSAANGRVIASYAEGLVERLESRA